MFGVATVLQNGESAEETTRSLLEQLLPQWLQFPGHRLIFALIIVAIGVYFSKVFVRLLGRSVAQRFARQSVAQSVLGGVRGLTILFSVFIAGSILGLGLDNILFNLAVFSAVVGVILAPIVGNIINGVFVLADQPFEIGDMIELEDGTQGFVDDITIRYTKIFTLDNTFMVIPNGNIRERDVANYSAEDERTRISLDVLITYESDVPTARSMMERAARDIEPVIKGGPDIRVGTARYPAGPACLIQQYGDDGILLRLRYWVRAPYKIGSIQSNVRTRIAELFEDADVEMAYPHRHIVFDETSGSANVSITGQQSGSAEDPEHAVADTSADTQ
ncbi:mechanosensitive ion channel family protein [Natronocalculus amylovorans]|uniref:Mechanosensitive ion channel family protein n=1 Tax=Natronocalculus amylovorans TaxID=2917812 RepID=A0AAE3K880_9EURY|nr:mechanosensitive ion channel family protein [Natronocalculus amylovorans]MCL9816235.1 mechanosensitive ion channel family protein [Natronocalculus amylovorans]